MQALANTSVDSSSHVYLLQRVVEGLHVHVCVDTCTLEFKVDVHSIDVIWQCICACIFSQDGDSWPTPQCWCRTACQSTRQIAVSDNQTSAHGGPCMHTHVGHVKIH